MNAEPLALPLACLLIVGGIAPAVSAQSLEEQAEEAVQKAAGTAGDAAEDPQAAADNATNASWQGSQANWTQTWTCRTASAADERAGEAAEETLDCAPASARAGEEEDEQAEAQEADDTTARAEEAEADAERAARDALAAAEAFLESSSEEPTEAPSHAATFVNRTLAILTGLVDDLVGLSQLPLAGAQLVATGLTSGFEATLSAGQTGAQGVASIVTSAAQGVQSGVGTAADAGQRSVSMLAEAGQAGLDRGWTGVASLAELVRGEPETDSVNILDDNDAGQPRAEEVLDEAVQLPEPA